MKQNRKPRNKPIHIGQLIYDKGGKNNAGKNNLEWI